MTNHAVTVQDSTGTSTQIYSNGYYQQQVIKNFVHSMANTKLDSALKLDEAIRACSGFNLLQEVIDKMVADCRKVNDAETFLRDYCGITIPFLFKYKPNDFGWAWGSPSVSVNMSYTNFAQSDKTGGGLDGALVQ